MGLGMGGAPDKRRRTPRWFFLLIAVLIVTVAGMTVEAVRLDRALHQTRCNSAKATLSAVLSGSAKASSDVISRALAAACPGPRQIFDL